MAAAYMQALGLASHKELANLARPGGNQIRLSRKDKDPLSKRIGQNLIRNSPCQSPVDFEYSFQHIKEGKMLDPGWSEAARLIGG